MIVIYTFSKCTLYGRENIYGYVYTIFHLNRESFVNIVHLHPSTC